MLDRNEILVCYSRSIMCILRSYGLEIRVTDLPDCVCRDVDPTVDLGSTVDF